MLGVVFGVGTSAQGARALGTAGRCLPPHLFIFWRVLIHFEILFVYTTCWFTIVNDGKFDSGNKIKHDD
jgi:hypothetical protein